MDVAVSRRPEAVMTPPRRTPGPGFHVGNRHMTEPKVGSAEGLTIAMMIHHTQTTPDSR